MIILEISNHMTYFRDVAHDKIISIWKKHFFSAGVETKVLMLYVANEVITQSSRKNKLEYIKGFGDIFIDVFREILK
jgi:hypothetical protein